MEIPVRTDEAREYLEEKYHETFALGSALSPGLDQPFAEIFFYSESHPAEAVKVYDDYHSFSDNYYGILVRHDMQALLNETVQTLHPGAAAGFRFRYSTLADSLSNPAAFSRELKAHKEYFAVNLFVFADSAWGLGKEDYERMTDALREKCVTGSVMLYLVSGEELSRAEKEGFDTFMSDNCTLRAAFSSYIR